MKCVCPTCYQTLPMAFDGIRVVSEENCFIWKTLSCKLTPTETDIMSVLVDAAPHWLSTEDILYKAIGLEAPMAKALSVHFTHIRRKLRDAQIPIVIASQGRAGGGHRNFRLEYGY